MYCAGCGENLEDDVSFCHICGRKINTGSASGNTTVNFSGHESAFLAFRKSSGVAILFGILIMGGGHIYAGKISRGIGIFLAGAVGWIIAILPLMLSANKGNIDSLTSIIAVLVITNMIVIIFWFWSLYDAHKLIDEYNDSILRTGRPPW